MFHIYPPQQSAFPCIDDIRTIWFSGAPKIQVLIPGFNTGLESGSKHQHSCLLLAAVNRRDKLMENIVFSGRIAPRTQIREDETADIVDKAHYRDNIYTSLFGIIDTL